MSEIDTGKIDFEEALEHISKRYLACFGELYEVLGEEF